MAISPIVRREVRAETRNRWNHWLRLLSAVACTIVAAALLVGEATPSAGLGTKLFGSLHVVLLLATLIIGPALTADCLSREQREGTLGLLFLTPLKSETVVFGKGFVHMLRAVTLWAAALPVMAIPLLLGGVTWLDLASAFIFQFCVMLLSLGAGMLASSLCTKPISAIICAQVLALAFGFSYILFRELYAFASSAIGAAAGGLITQGLGGDKSAVLSGPVRRLAGWLLFVTGLLGGAIVIFVGCMLVAARRVRKRWQDRPPSARSMRCHRFWAAPRFQSARFVQLRRRVLDRNPMGWLERYSTGRRVLILGWCAIILFLDSALMLSDQPWTYFGFTQMWLAVLLTLNIASESATLFRQERETGALELLLVTPLSVDQLIIKRLLAFWRRFRWPVALVVALNWLILWRDMGWASDLSFTTFLILNYATAPIIGFWLSLRMRSFTSAFLTLALLTVAWPAVVPEMWTRMLTQKTLLELPWFFELAGYMPEMSRWCIRATQFAQIVIALGCWLALRRMLAQRTFITKSELVELPAPRAVKWQNA